MTLRPHWLKRGSTHCCHGCWAEIIWTKTHWGEVEHNSGCPRADLVRVQHVYVQFGGATQLLWYPALGGKGQVQQSPAPASQQRIPWTSTS